MTADPCQQSAYTLILDSGKQEECLICDGGKVRGAEVCFACEGLGYDTSRQSTVHVGPFASMAQAQQALQDVADKVGTPKNARIVSIKPAAQANLKMEDARNMTAEQVLEHTNKAKEQANE